MRGEEEGKKKEIRLEEGNMGQDKEEEKGNG